MTIQLYLTQLFLTNSDPKKKMLIFKIYKLYAANVYTRSIQNPINLILPTVKDSSIHSKVTQKRI